MLLLYMQNIGPSIHLSPIRSTNVTNVGRKWKPGIQRYQMDGYMFELLDTNTPPSVLLAIATVAALVIAWYVSVSRY
jgi:hypothetical protein